MKNRTEKAELKEEIRRLAYSNEKDKDEENRNKQFVLWKQNMQICARLFQITPSYKQIISIEGSRFKKEKSVEEINLICKEIHGIFIEVTQALLEVSPGLTYDDLLYCILKYLKLSIHAIKTCMRVESSQALAQRKYRIKKQISPQIFTLIFSDGFPSK